MTEPTATTMTLRDANALDAIVEMLGIADTDEVSPADAVRELRADVERLRDAIRWALGEGDSDFADHTDLTPSQPYWWRTELRRRAGL